MPYKDLETKIDYLSEEEKIFIRKAFDFSKYAHEGQKRHTGEPFVTHEVQTAAFIADLKLDSNTIAAALMHDVCEDTDCQLSEIKNKFGKEVAQLVDGVTKLGRIRIRRKWLVLKDQKELAEYDRQVETLRKMFMAMAKDIRVILIKLADRLHNMKTLQGVPEEKHYRIAKETIEIYAPLAYRLGMGQLKGQLEDLAFPFVYPNEYAELKKRIVGKLEKKEKYIEKLKRSIYKKLAKQGIRAEIHGRTKHIYSLWRKLQRYDNDLNRIYDLVALRIIVSNVDECYKVLGVIHENFKPLVGRIKDYVSMPKPNGYQSIHTTVFATNGEIVEIQIRTKEMHDRAENGIAAHWHYSEKKGTLDYLLRRSSRVPQKELVWVNELVNWQKQIDNKDVVAGLGMDFFSDRIFVYTPEGDVKNLPVGSTPIDFAYAIHTDIGNTLYGAKVNGKIVDFSHQLQNGDICTILTKKGSVPKRDWLDHIKTSLARGKIRTATKGK